MAALTPLLVREEALHTFGRVLQGGGDPPPCHVLRLQFAGLTHVLVLGGTPERRHRVALAHHRGSPLRDGPLVVASALHDADDIRRALQAWTTEQEARDNPLRAAERGTLFLDDVEHLDARAQRQLARLARAIVDPWNEGGMGRLIVGNAGSLEDAASEGRFSADLLDIVDKVRVELSTAGVAHRSRRRTAGVLALGSILPGRALDPMFAGPS